MLREEQVNALTFGLFPSNQSNYVLCSRSLTDFETMVSSKYRDQNRKASC